ncbi:hypothetical protein GQ457_05G016670 [Hibiscus cannabinus]
MRTSTHGTSCDFYKGRKHKVIIRFQRLGVEAQATRKGSEDANFPEVRWRNGPTSKEAGRAIVKATPVFLPVSPRLPRIEKKEGKKEMWKKTRVV